MSESNEKKNIAIINKEFLNSLSDEERILFHQMRGKKIKEAIEEKKRKQTVRDTFMDLANLNVYEDSNFSVTILEKIAMATLVNMAEKGDVKEAKYLAQIFGEDVLDSKTDTTVNIVLPESLKNLGK